MLRPQWPQLAQRIQVDQYGMVKTCFGKDFFLKSDHPRLRAARGIILLKEMEVSEFNEMVRELKRITEARGKANEIGAF